MYINTASVDQSWPVGDLHVTPYAEYSIFMLRVNRDEMATLIRLV